MNTLAHWVFGYGSLLWNPGFAYVSKSKVRVDGYARRMWQGSTDHRGTPEYPGLVCTLVPGDFCWGMAYQISDQDWPRIRAELDYREKDGYDLVRLAAEGPDGRLEVWTYVADERNPSYIGAQSTSALAERMARAAGESGPNWDYLFRLETVLRELDIEDEHVFDLAEELRARLVQ
jgi:glutathione-specific gamma-glutamylcyclotransferase